MGELRPACPDPQNVYTVAWEPRYMGPTVVQLMVENEYG